MVNITAAQRALSGVPFFRLIAMTTGGQMGVPMLLSLGMRPYMTAMILVQAVQTVAADSYGQLSFKQQGYIARGITLALAVVQVVEMLVVMRQAFIPIWLPGTRIDLAVPIAFVLLLAGGMFTTWLADENTQHGIGGTVVLILPSLIASMPLLLQNGLGVSFPLTLVHLWWTAGISAAFFLIMAYLNQAELRIPLQRTLTDITYAPSYMPIRLLPAGAMPFMFSAAFFAFPAFFTATTGARAGWQKVLVTWTSFNTWQGITTYAVIVIGLGYAFGMMNLQPVQEAKGMRKAGDYILNVHPGDETEAFLMHQFWVMSFYGNTVLLLIGVLPLVIGLWIPGAANFSQFLGMIYILISIVDMINQQAGALWNKDRYDLFA
ncbi:hypothetical protein L248_0818 [Schleiferilactobacillus shenzhenensis LY-73]|uniref:Preprotein translocase subunit SecY n=2 Tax=Schleiferilactobacillus shenzhenensis TaxID=1231337 RepID=U4TRJ3_9LACO|nr:hypothetical protein L248_0818 [Schleiferilactobacillus shenzhenensis LY-73]